MSLAIGIPTYNRKRIVELHARSVCTARLPDDVPILVIDDASAEYDLDFLRSLYPPGTVVERRSMNSGGADFAAADVLRRLVATGADCLLLLDSDMVLASEFALEVEARLKGTDGLMSLFNSPTHAVVGEDGPLLVKASVGAAATVWSRELALEVLAKVPVGENWDWRFSEYLRSTGRRVYATRQSFAQHLGFNEGAHSNTLFGDIGLGFADSNPVNAYLMIEQLMLDGQMRAKALIEENALLRRRIRVLEAVTGVWTVRQAKRWLRLYRERREARRRPQA